MGREDWQRKKLRRDATMRRCDPTLANARQRDARVRFGSLRRCSVHVRRRRIFVDRYRGNSGVEWRLREERERFRSCRYGLARRDQSTNQGFAWSSKHSETLGTRNDGWLSTRTHPTEVLARFAQMRASPPISNRNVAESNFPRPHRLSAENVRFVARTTYARRCSYRGIGGTLQKERSILPGFPVRLFESRIYQKNTRLDTNDRQSHPDRNLAPCWNVRLQLIRPLLGPGESPRWQHRPSLFG